MPADPAITAALRAARTAYLETHGGMDARRAAAIAAFLRAMPELRFPNGESVARWSPNAAEHVATAVKEAARDE